MVTPRLREVNPLAQRHIVHRRQNQHNCYSWKGLETLAAHVTFRETERIGRKMVQTPTAVLFLSHHTFQPLVRIISLSTKQNKNLTHTPLPHKLKLSFHTNQSVVSLAPKHGVHKPGYPGPCHTHFNNVIAIYYYCPSWRASKTTLWVLGKPKNWHSWEEVWALGEAV